MLHCIWHAESHNMIGSLYDEFHWTLWFMIWWGSWHVELMISWHSEFHGMLQSRCCVLWYADFHIRNIPLLRNDVDCEPGSLNRVLELDLTDWLGRVRPHNISCSRLCGSHPQRDMLNNVASPDSLTQASATIKQSGRGARDGTPLKRKDDDKLFTICSKTAS
jgi:hypothetical protein